MEDWQTNNDDASIAMNIDIKRNRYPFCVVWTPIPLITWIFPFIGHMGIATGRGVIRDFAGSYYVSEDNMGFGWPTLYWQLDPSRVSGGSEAWDRAVNDASDEYKTHCHNLFCDNCHSHVALALNNMQYNQISDYNMVKLCFWMMFKGRFVGVIGFLKQWLPFTVIMLGIILLLIFIA